MCGRTSLFTPRETLEERFGATIDSEVQYQPRFNIAPGDNLEVIPHSDSETIHQFKWGFQPEWADEPGRRLINAREETVASKQSFKEAWQQRPCLVLSSGFYEWEETARGPKQPHRIYIEDSDAFAMAGLWQRQKKNGGQTSTVTILTTEPNEVIEPIHDRMPVILPEEKEDDWLHSGSERRAQLCRPYPGDDLAAYPISRAVNDPSNDSATIIEKAGSSQSDLGEFS